MLGEDPEVAGVVVDCVAGGVVVAGVLGALVSVPAGMAVVGDADAAVDAGVSPFDAGDVWGLAVAVDGDDGTRDSLMAAPTGPPCPR